MVPIIDRLRKLADSLDKQIYKPRSTRPILSMTARMFAQAGSSASTLRKLEDELDIIKLYIKAHERGTIDPLLAHVATKSVIKLLRFGAAAWRYLEDREKKTLSAAGITGENYDEAKRAFDNLRYPPKAKPEMTLTEKMLIWPDYFSEPEPPREPLVLTRQHGRLHYKPRQWALMM